jgi:protein ImuB
MIRPGTQTWLCLHFPRLPLEVFAAPDNLHEAAARPLAIIEQQCVVGANQMAVERGLEFGMALNTAHALCADLLALERQPQREWDMLQQLAHWVYGLTPEVALAADNSLLLEIGACRRLYGGIAPLLDIIRRGLHERGHAVVIGLAHTRKAAWLLARREHPPALADDRLEPETVRHQLDALPIELLAIERAISSVLGKMGIHTLGELAALPLAALGKRFGAGFIRYLQQVLGTHPDPQPPFVPLSKFQAGLSFIDGIHNRQALLFPMRRLLQTLGDYLHARQLLCTALHWELHDAHAPQATMTIELMRAEKTPGANRLRNLLELSELKLQNLPLREAVYTLILRSAEFLPAQPANPQLFAADDFLHADGACANPLDALIDKLRARLGATALDRLSYRALHWPEAASVQRSIDTAETTTCSTEIPLPLRPLWLLPAPQPLHEHDQKLFWHSALDILRGPERIDNHWWEQTPAARDYYIARAADGRRCWIFRDTGSGHWFAHGLFA